MTNNQKRRLCEVMNAAIEVAHPRYSYSYMEEHGIVLTIDVPVGGPVTKKVNEEELIQELAKWPERLGAKAHGFESQCRNLEAKAEEFRGKALDCRELLAELNVEDMPASEERV